MTPKNAPHIDAVAQIVSKCLHTSAFQIERVLSGVSTYVYRIRLYRDILYVRILPEQGKSLGVEARVHSLLRQQGVRVPEVVYFEHVNEATGLSLMIVNEIPGSDAGRCSSMNEYGNIVAEAGKQIAIVNQVAVNGFGWIKREKEESGSDLQGEKSSLHDCINECLEQDLLALSEYRFTGEETTRILRILDAGVPLMARHRARLVHGDFDDSHIFQHDGSYTGMIDFGEMQGSSPLYDLGHFKLHDGQRFIGFPSLARGYNEVRDLSDEDRIEIDLWALWIGIRRLGMISKRMRGPYHEHLVRTVKTELDVLNRSL
ncbi:phosphotransferase family protein [Paenibacillus sp. GYB003]|uniref:phosphotransferase family protein n=1 Tax=Paenibacillus sp. GYB003 TaxID=2994392 RepID=UPI002F96136B